MTKYGKPQAEIIAAMHEKGLSPRIIAKALDIPLYRIEAILKFAQEDCPTFTKVMNLKRTGMTDTDIARALGFSKQYIARLTPPRRESKGDNGNYQFQFDAGEWSKLIQIAEEFNLIAEDGLHAGRGSVRKLLQQIALGNLYVLRHHFPDEPII